MKINLREKATGNKVEAYILPAKKKDMPLKRDGWNFDWQKLIRFDQNFQCYKVVLKDSPNIIEALALFSYINNELFYMNQVEASPTNRSNNGKYEAAGALIAYGCSLALENPNSITTVH